MIPLLVYTSNLRHLVLVNQFEHIVHISQPGFVESDIGKWSVKNKLGHHSEHTNKALEGEALQQLHKHLYNNYKPHVMHMLLCDYGCLG